MSLSEQAVRYMAAAAAAYGPQVLASSAQAGTDTPEMLGRGLLRMLFGVQDPGLELPLPLADLVASPADPDRQAVLEEQVDSMLDEQPGLPSAISEMLAGFYRQQAAAGDAQALVGLGDLLNWQQVTYSRTGEGWTGQRHSYGSSFGHDPIARPGYRRDLDGQPMVCGGSAYATQPPPPGHPAIIVTGRAAPAVTHIALIQDGHEDRRPLRSHFGVWVVCTEQLTPFQVAGLDQDGTVLATLHIPLRGPR